jgi:Cu(I)/Ag(I) efflux system membrane fusion protein
MKTKLPWILVVVLAAALVVAVVARPHESKPVQKSVAKKVLYWVDPMHPQYKSDKPGKAPDCGMDLVPVYEQPAGAITIPEQQQRLVGVQTSEAQTRTISRTVTAVATITADETRLARVTTKFDGYIERLYVDFTGKPVHRGQPLFTIYSPDLLSTQQEYLLALRAAKQSPQLLEAARQRLRLWDISDAEVRQLEQSGVPKKSLTVHSPVNGVVTNKLAVAGARVMAGEPLFEIANLDRVWAVADVYESELAFVHAGAPATMTLSYIPGRTWTGRVSFIAPDVDPMTRTVKVRVEFDNRDGALKPAMFANVAISSPSRSVVAVPESAVLQTGTRALVYVASGSSFEPRAVALGSRGDGFYEVSGVSPGERVVTQANFLIDSESRLRR